MGKRARKIARRAVARRGAGRRRRRHFSLWDALDLLTGVPSSGGEDAGDGDGDGEAHIEAVPDDDCDGPRLRELQYSYLLSPALELVLSLQQVTGEPAGELATRVVKRRGLRALWTGQMSLWAFRVLAGLSCELLAPVLDSALARDAVFGLAAYPGEVVATTRRAVLLSPDEQVPGTRATAARLFREGRLFAGVLPHFAGVLVRAAVHRATARALQEHRGGEFAALLVSALVELPFSGYARRCIVGDRSSSTGVGVFAGCGVRALEVVVVQGLLR